MDDAAGDSFGGAGQDYEMKTVVFCESQVGDEDVRRIVQHPHSSLVKLATRGHDGLRAHRLANSHTECPVRVGNQQLETASVARHPACRASYKVVASGIEKSGIRNRWIPDQPGISCGTVEI
jgi:hypothetical protein